LTPVTARRAGKIRALDELAVILQESKAAGRTIVHCHGVFDLIHIGHIRHLETARAMGDVLVVTLTSDQHVNKGPHRPAFSQDLRAEALAALDAVDYVAINRWPMSIETIRLLRPDIYVKGSDYKLPEEDITGGIALEIDAVRAVGGRVCYTDDTVFSSSKLLNRFLSSWSPEVDQYLAGCREQFSAAEVVSWLDRAYKLKPLVVGESIIDEYLFCEGIGKSTKDPVLAVLQEATEAFAGGTLAVANHLAGLCCEVELITQLGDRDRREDFARSALRPNVRPWFLTKNGAPTIHKRRIVDRYSGNKLLELYNMDDAMTKGENAAELKSALDEALPRRDLTIVADYGHGMLTAEAIDLMCRKAPFLAVNVQSNAGNRGFNPISKYRRADYVCLAKHEVAIETRNRDGLTTDRITEVAKRIDCPRFTVTQGKDGSLYYDRESGFVESPALATQVLDRVGAGDAVLAVTSLLVHLGAPAPLVSFVGNVAGAQLVAELGNRTPVERVALERHIISLLK
jgi:rfaE bifunctional protein nucleotidyltransferase chain/domain